MESPTTPVEPRAQPGMVYTFYSYKGGVGRSMALANVAALLALWNRRVLIVDMDLEAPGLQRFFMGAPAPPSSSSNPQTADHRLLDEARCNSTPGMVDLVVAQRDGAPLDWRSCVLEAPIPGAPRPVHLITAGRPDADYPKLLQGINWSELFRERGLGTYLDRLRQEWLKEFDFVLIDSRTGISDIGGICTILLPDVIVLVFTSNQQSIDGVENVMRRAREAQARMPLDRGRLLAVPLPARDERDSHHAEMAKRWIDQYEAKFGDYFEDWLPREVTTRDALQKLYIPYIARWSFGERLPVVEENTLQDPRSISAAYSRLAALLEGRLDWRGVEDATLLAARAETRRLAEVAEGQTVRASAAAELADRLEMMVKDQRVDVVRAQAKASQAVRWLKIGAVLALLIVVGAVYFTKRFVNLEQAAKVLRAMDRSEDPLIARMLVAELRELPEPEDGTLSARVNVRFDLVPVSAIVPTGKILRNVHLDADGSHVLGVYADGSARKWAVATAISTDFPPAQLLDGLPQDEQSILWARRGGHERIVTVAREASETKYDLRATVPPGAAIDGATFVGGGAALVVRWHEQGSTDVLSGVVWVAEKYQSMNGLEQHGLVALSPPKGLWVLSADGTQCWTPDAAFGLAPEQERAFKDIALQGVRFAAVDGARTAFVRTPKNGDLELVCNDFAKRDAERVVSAMIKTELDPKGERAGSANAAPILSIAIVGDAHIVFADPASWRPRAARKSAEPEQPNPAAPDYIGRVRSAWFWRGENAPDGLDSADQLVQEGWTELHDVSRDGKRVATVDRDGTIWVWTLESSQVADAWSDLIEQVTRQTCACLTPDQRAQWLDEERKVALERWEACERALNRMPSSELRERVSVRDEVQRPVQKK